MNGFRLWPSIVSGRGRFRISAMGRKNVKDIDQLVTLFIRRDPGASYDERYPHTMLIQILLSRSPWLPTASPLSPAKTTSVLSNCPFFSSAEIIRPT